MHPTLSADLAAAIASDRHRQAQRARLVRLALRAARPQETLPALRVPMVRRLLWRDGVVRHPDVSSS